ncbi:hypothetical protein HXX76_005047 [Chlamydomonas incerta]|uniref:Uncharacterized protein n=1 Tax=Chlamydomonas incerta TaxID=51695 RepID=A0A835T6T2_CHLIN|nr:hypothetical protein HXX76_005047 [Chlamydomonas incerta]|eukprot:KAG2438496.1 hypothetical protein HXX76_005047 [Chlamydomonas incerta]
MSTATEPAAGGGGGGVGAPVADNAAAAAAGGAGGVGADAAAAAAATLRSFLVDLCCGLNRDETVGGPCLSREQLAQLAGTLLAPDALVHPDGLLGAAPELTGPLAFLDIIEAERAAYKTVGLETLLTAASPDGDVAFALSRYRMHNVGPWRGQPATGRVSEGVRLDELRLNTAGQVVEAWCNRQLFEEERSLLLRDPPTHHAACFDPAWLVPVPAGPGGSGGEAGGSSEAGGGGGGGTNPMSAEQLLRVARMWAEAWNCAADAGPPDPDLLDGLAEPGFSMWDALGLTGDQGQSHPYTAVKGLDAAKATLTSMAQKYDVEETVQAAAAQPGYNAVFLHWVAKLTPRPDTPAPLNPAATAAGGGGADEAATGIAAAAGAAGNADAGGDMAAAAAAPTAPYHAEATDLLIFSPTSGKLTDVFQFRRPLGSDRRAVLKGPAAAKRAAAAADMSPAGVHGSVSGGGGGGGAVEAAQQQQQQGLVA